MVKEWQEQEALIEWISYQYPFLLDYTIKIHNEGKFSQFVGKRLNAQGRLKGASDLFIAYPSKGFHGLFIEMKTKDGKLSKKQSEFLFRMSNVGYKATACWGADQAITVIREYVTYSRP